MTAMAIMRLLPQFITIDGGRILFNGLDLSRMKEEEIRTIRGKHISMIIQDPLSSLNPAFKIRWQLAEILRAHGGIGGGKGRSVQFIKETLQKVTIPEIDRRVSQYPHQLSGGMRQRVVIAMAIVLEPRLIIADEPTTALDVTTQKEIFDLFEDLRKQFKLSFLIISHDLYLMSERCDRMYVMYSGQIVEEGTAHQVFTDPLHPYTRGLLACVPNFADRETELQEISGELPSIENYPHGCRFHDRCPYAIARCRNEVPGYDQVSEGRYVRCLRHGEI
jgi:oligopeptide/dipeptide ABC transporter ATP-binding protein